RAVPIRKRAAMGIAAPACRPWATSNHNFTGQPPFPCSVEIASWALFGLSRDLQGATIEICSEGHRKARASPEALARGVKRPVFGRGPGLGRGLPTTPLGATAGLPARGGKRRPAVTPRGTVGRPFPNAGFVARQITRRAWGQVGPVADRLCTGSAWI